MARSKTIDQVMQQKDYASSPSDLIAGGTTEGKMREKNTSLPKKEIERRLAQYFPDVDPGEVAMDAYVIIQELKVPEKIGSIIRIDDAKDADQATMSIGKVVSIGPLAFISDTTGEYAFGKNPPPFKIGDYVRMPKYGGQDFIVDGVIFNYFFDRDVKGVITNMSKVLSI